MAWQSEDRCGIIDHVFGGEGAADILYTSIDGTVEMSATKVVVSHWQSSCPEKPMFCFARRRCHQFLREERMQEAAQLLAVVTSATWPLQRRQDFGPPHRDPIVPTLLQSP